MKPQYPLKATNETGDVTVDIQGFTVPDSSITASSGMVNIATATGDVTGPASATNEAATVFDGTTGKTVKDGAAVNVLQKRAVESFTTTATAAGTTTLTVASNPIQEFTGVTTQTIVLPVVTTLPKTGFGFTIINNSTGALTVNSSGANLVQTIVAGGTAVITCILLTGTTAASWDSANVGDANGPASSTDNAIARFDSTTGKLLQNSTVTIDDNGVISFPADQYITAGGVDLLGYSTGGTTTVVNGGGGDTLALRYGSNATLRTSGGADAATFDANAVAGNTRMLLYDVDNATLERVSVGAADSGGAGFKVLRIPN